MNSVEETWLAIIGALLFAGFLYVYRMYDKVSRSLGDDLDKIEAAKLDLELTRTFLQALGVLGLGVGGLLTWYSVTTNTHESTHIAIAPLLKSSITEIVNSESVGEKLAALLIVRDLSIEHPDEYSSLYLDLYRAPSIVSICGNVQSGSEVASLCLALSDAAEDIEQNGTR